MFNKSCVLKENPVMDRLKVLHSTVDFSRLIKETGEVREIESPTGSIFVVDVYKSDEIGIVRSTSSKGSSMQPHEHDALEIIILYEGRMKLTFADKEVELNESRQTYYILPGIVHGAEFMEETKALGITVPLAY